MESLFSESESFLNEERINQDFRTPMIVERERGEEGRGIALVALGRIYRHEKWAALSLSLLCKTFVLSFWESSWGR